MNTIIIVTLIITLIVISITYVFMSESSMLRKLLNLKSVNAVQGNNSEYIQKSINDALVPRDMSYSNERTHYDMLKKLFETTKNANHAQRNLFDDNSKSRQIMDYNARVKLKNLKQNLVLEEQIRSKHDKEIISLLKNDNAERVFFIDDMKDAFNTYNSASREKAQVLDSRFQANLQTTSNYINDSLLGFSKLHNSQVNIFNKALENDTNGYNAWMDASINKINTSTSNMQRIIKGRLNAVNEQMDMLADVGLEAYHHVEYSNYVVDHDAWKTGMKDWMNETRCNMSIIDADNSTNMKGTSQLASYYNQNIRNFTYKDNVLSNQLMAIQNNIDMQKQALELALLSEDDMVSKKISLLSNDMYTNTSLSTRVMTVGAATFCNNQSAFTLNLPGNTMSVNSSRGDNLMQIDNSSLYTYSNVVGNLSTQDLTVNNKLVLNETCINNNNLCFKKDNTTFYNVKLSPGGLSVGNYPMNKTEDDTGVTTRRFTAGTVLTRNIQQDGSPNVDVSTTVSTLGINNVNTNQFYTRDAAGSNAYTTSVKIGSDPSTTDAKLLVNKNLNDWQTSLGVAQIAHGLGQGLRVNNVPMFLRTANNSVVVDTQAKRINVKSQVCVNSDCFSKASVQKLGERIRDNVIIFDRHNYEGNYKVYKKGDYINSTTLNNAQFGGNKIKSMWIGSNVKVRVFSQPNRNDNYTNEQNMIQAFNSSKPDINRTIAELEVVEYNQPDIPPIDCLVSDWTGWSGCSRLCGGGIQSRSRRVTRNAMGAGRACPSPMYEERSCNTDACRGCGYSEWRNNYGCSHSCGGGWQNQVRNVVQWANNGESCVHTSQNVPCNTHPCPIHCVVSDWSCEPCYSSPSGIIRKCTRRVTQWPAHGGNPCPADMEKIESYPQCQGNMSWRLIGFYSSESSFPNPKIFFSSGYVDESWESQDRSLRNFAYKARANFQRYFAVTRDIVPIQKHGFGFLFNSPPPPPTSSIRNMKQYFANTSYLQVGCSANVSGFEGWCPGLRQWAVYEVTYT